MVGAMIQTPLTRRSLLSALSVAPLVLRAANKHIPVGLELYSVRNELKRDPEATLKAVAAMGYQCVEFFAPYYQWTNAEATNTRKLLDSLKLRCYSTHNSSENFSDEKLPHAIELNHILGSKYIVMASTGEISDLDGWKKVAGQLDHAGEKMRPMGIHPGYHNHLPEFTPINGVVPMEILAKNTAPDVMLQLDVGTCLEAGADPVAWIEHHPGRIRSLHCKDWDKAQGYKVLVGEGSAPWKKIFQAAESVGGVEYYLIEQEGSRYSELETAKRCLISFKSLHR
jgi:sugar phosphate isomerase/epimerase